MALVGFAGTLVASIAATRLTDWWTRYKSSRLDLLTAGKAADKNHDEARALRLAQLEALRLIIEPYEKRLHEAGLELAADRDIVRQASAWVRQHIGATPSLDISLNPDVEDDLRRAVNTALTGLSGLRETPGAPADMRAAAEAAVLAEIEADVGVLPERLTTLLKDPTEGWFPIFARQLGQKFKNDADFNSIWTAMRLALLGSDVAAIRDDLRRLDEALFGKPPVELYLPDLDSVRSEDRFSYKNPDIAFVGREDELAVLDEFLDAEPPFLWMMLTGGGGAGKSRLALELCKRR